MFKKEKGRKPKASQPPGPQELTFSDKGHLPQEILSTPSWQDLGDVIGTVVRGQLVFSLV